MQVEHCCLDASAFSIGFAASHGNTLILGESENVLSDFVDPIAPSTVTKPYTAQGRAFAEFLRKAGCISGQGILDTPSLAPAAARYAVDMDFNILLGVKIVFCKNNCIQIYTNSGLQNIVCQNIIRCPKAKTDSKRLNCIVSGTDDDISVKFQKFGGRIYQSFEKGEYILSLPFRSACRLNEARAVFVNKIRACFGTSVLIDAFAADFEYNREFGGIIEEFEAGVNYDL